jgi:hypothetical protein
VFILRTESNNNGNNSANGWMTRCKHFVNKTVLLINDNNNNFFIIISVIGMAKVSQYLNCES